MLTKVSATISALILVGTLIGGWIWFDSTYAKAADVRANAVDIKINSLQDSIRWYQDQMSYIMSSCKKGRPEDLPEPERTHYRNYYNKWQEFDKQLTILYNKRNSR